MTRSPAWPAPCSSSSRELEETGLQMGPRRGVEAISRSRRLLHGSAAGGNAAGPPPAAVAVPQGGSRATYLPAPLTWTRCRRRGAAAALAPPARRRCRCVGAAQLGVVLQHRRGSTPLTGHPKAMRRGREGRWPREWLAGQDPNGYRHELASSNQKSGTCG